MFGITAESEPVFRPSLSIFIALLVWLALFLVPAFGELMAFFAGAFLVGILIHALMLSLFIEAMIGRIGRAWLVVPFGLYGSYYAICYYQTILVDRKSAELRASNPGQIVDFDPTRYSLVTQEAERLVSRYRIPVAFIVDRTPKGEGFSSLRLLRKDQCKNPIGRFPAIALALYPEYVMYQK